MDERAAVDDRLAARPAELVEHVRDRLGQDDVARCDGERQAIAGEAGGRRVDGEDCGACPNAAGPCLDAPPSREAGHLGALVDPHAALEQLRAQPEREPRRLNGCVQAVERASEEERRGAASANVVG